jgi:hypothetical protein
VSKHLQNRKPAEFGFERFSDLLSSRPTLPGEDLGCFEALRAGIISSLAPVTPYECVIAESLVAIEWELLQRRRMRELSLTKKIRGNFMAAAIIKAEAMHDAAVDEERDRHWDAFIEDGGEEDEWQDPHPFDKAREWERISAIFDAATSLEPAVREEALKTIEDMGLSLEAAMAHAYADAEGDAPRHDTKVQELERRRREVMRDYDAILRARPIDQSIGRSEVDDAEVVSK